MIYILNEFHKRVHIMNNLDVETFAESADFGDLA